MHKTLSSKYIGHVSEVKSISDGYQIKGWLVPLNDIGQEALIVTSNNQVAVYKEDRPDVAKFYNTTADKYIKSGFKIIVDDMAPAIAIAVNGEAVFTVDLDNINCIILPAENRIPELVVVDNFYKDVDKVREYALKQEFVAQSKYHKGKRTTKQYIPNWCKDSFSKYLGKEVKEFVGATGVFQYCVAEDSIVYHYDTQEYAAMVYLSPDAPLSSGTSTYKSKLTGLMKTATEEDAKRMNKTIQEINAESFNGNNFYDKHNMELVDSVANVYNRMVIFNAQALHSATSYYGNTKENSRLFHLFFFNLAK